MKRTAIACLTALIAVGIWAPSTLAQQDLDWSAGVVEAIGIGVPPTNIRSKAQGRAMAVRAATADAQRNLIETLQGVSIDAETTVEDAMASDIIRTKVKGILRGARRVGKPTYLEDGAVEITLAVRMRGALTDALLPKEGFSTPVPEPETKVSKPEGPTGLIVDARGLGLSPAMAPKVVDEADRLVYGAKVVNREAAVQHGIAAYEKDLDLAKKSDRTGGSPIVVKGVKATGRNKANVVVAEADGDRVRKAADGQSFLNQCKVIVVVD